MKYAVSIALCILLLPACMTSGNLDRTDVCPELIELVKNGWKQKSVKGDLIHYCSKDFDNRFRRYLEEEFCENTLTKENIITLLGPPSRVVQSDTGGKLMGIYDDVSEHESLVYYCKPCKRLFREQKNKINRTYYFCINKNTREYVGYYATGSPYID